MKKEHAKALYKMGGESREIALQYFSENELIDTRPKSWDDLGGITGWYINTWSDIEAVNKASTCKTAKNIFPTKEYAEAALALAQLLQIKQRWFSGEFDYECAELDDIWGIGITRHGVLFVGSWADTPRWTHFPNRQMAKEFISEPEICKLLEQVKPLL